MSLPSAPASDEPFDPRHNITAKEIDRDLINLHLPELDLIATDEECAALYPPGVYKQMQADIQRDSDGVIRLEPLIGPALKQIWSNPDYSFYTKIRPLVPATLLPGGLLFLGINPSYSPHEEDAKDSTAPLFSQYDGGKLHPYYQAIEKFVAKISEGYEPQPWSGIDMLYARDSIQAGVVNYLDLPHGLEFVWEQLQLTQKVLQVAKPKVLIVANRFAAELLGKHRVTRKRRDGTDTEDKVWLGYHFHFDEELGTYRCAELDEVPVFFTKPFSGLGSIHTGKDVLERLAWHIRFVLKKTANRS